MRTLEHSKGEQELVNRMQGGESRLRRMVCSTETCMYKSLEMARTQCLNKNYGRSGRTEGARKGKNGRN